MRWASRLAPLGAPTLKTRLTSPQSMPRSSVEVHTTARSLPATMAASTLRRCRFSSTARQVDKTREEASQRLAAGGRRDDKCIASAGDFVEKFELIRVGAPAP